MRDCDRCALGRAECCPLLTITRPPGVLLITQGDVANGVWMIREGAALISSTTDSGEEALCSLRPRGSVLGLEALRGEPSDYEAWTLTPMRLCHLSTDGMRDWIDRSPAAARATLDVAVDELVRARDERIALEGRAVARLARFLAAHLRANGGPLALEQRVLARVLRMRSETLSRALAQLREVGALAHGRRVRVLDVERLAELAASE